MIPIRSLSAFFEIVYSSNRPTWGRGQAAFGQQDVYISRSWWPTGSWSAPRNLGGAVNTAGIEQRSTLSRDGQRLYFVALRRPPAN